MPSERQYAIGQADYGNGMLSDRGKQFAVLNFLKIRRSVDVCLNCESFFYSKFVIIHFLCKNILLG